MAWMSNHTCWIKVFKHTLIVPERITTIDYEYMPQNDGG
jgi:hypothetical protein